MKNQILSSLEELPSPSFVCEEELLEKNLKLLKYVQDETGINILLALKGFAMHSTFDLCKQYLKGCCASGLHEAILAKEEFGLEVHTYSPAFKDEEIDEIVSISNHLVFNSFSQLKRFKDRAYGKVSLGIRLNPEYSSVEVDLYNPCSPFSRMGTTKANFDDTQLKYLDGFHFHALCEQNVDALEGALKSFEDKFSQYFDRLKWVNFGGGHHITRADYDVERLIKLLKDFKSRYPHLKVYMEPGEAVGWQTGYLVATILDIIDNGMKLAILDTSAEAHMPDTLAMPYRAMIRNSGIANEKKYTYRFGGNTCLSGDIIGDYSFDEELKVGNKIILEDMIHYTMVKTTTFNGIKLPSIVIKSKDGSYKVIKNFGYEDYKMRLS
ncbi:carboxynorspermidine decarboxylase [Aliarcobacter lanthieri]|uniref:carboxynorspermidine decarboxylase n=1 Tax=Aliarcobacter lanthieri TaxID=1355374 RepID=UPI00047E117D|nr:carboxynorspermidine decarboxylase [Aliarcobacter lanthieri]QKF59824.1 carboxynorspermidine decarboxylase [Aliarcobacter lanthieri]